MTLEDQELLFNMFHDGSIGEITHVEEGFQFFIGIMYLAERINPKFNGLYVRLIHPTEFYFKDCDSDTLYHDLEELNRLELEILSARISGDKIRVFCSANNGQSYGYLKLRTPEIHIFDPEHTPIELSDLETICREYWGRL